MNYLSPCHPHLFVSSTPLNPLASQVLLSRQEYIVHTTSRPLLSHYLSIAYSIDPFLHYPHDKGPSSTGHLYLSHPETHFFGSRSAFFVSGALVRVPDQFPNSICH